MLSDQFNHSLWFTRPEIKPMISNENLHDNNHLDRGNYEKKIMKRKFKQLLSTIPPVSTKPRTTSP